MQESASWARIGEVELLTFKFIAESQIVTSTIPRHLISCLIGIDDRVGEVVESAPEAEETDDVDNGEEWESRIAGSDTEGAVGNGCLAGENTGVADEGNKSFIQQARRQSRGELDVADVVGVGGVEGEAWRAAVVAGTEGVGLWIARIEVTCAETLLCRHLIVPVHDDLVFLELTGNAEGRLSEGRAWSRNERGGDQVPARAVLQSEQGECNGINVGTVAAHLRASMGGRHITKGASDLCGGTVGRRDIGKQAAGERTGTEAVDLASPLVGTEEEETIFQDRSADRAAELILLHRRTRVALGLQKDVVGVENIVAEKLPDGAVKLIGAGFRDDFNVGAGIASKASVVHGGLDFELLDGIGVGDGDATLLEKVPAAPAPEVIDVRAIHNKAVADIAGPIDIDVGGPTPELGGVINISRNPRGKSQYLGVVAFGEWQGLDRSAPHRCPESRVLGLQ